MIAEVSGRALVKGLKEGLTLESLSHPLDRLSVFAHEPIIEQVEDFSELLGKVLRSGTEAVLSGTAIGKVARYASRLGIFSSHNRLDIEASTPSKIAWGYGELSVRQSALLESLPKVGRWLVLSKSAISATDLSALTAKTGDEYALFTLGSRRIVVRGNSARLEIEPTLSEKVISQNWKWSAHTHPGTLDKFLLSSGADRETLSVLGQEQSMILNSAGRRSVFNVTNDSLVIDNSLFDEAWLEISP